MGGDMLIGIVGKPNCGKSTLFNALTMADVPVANYPFTTIDAHIGVGYVRVPCVCREFEMKDNPKNSYCIDGNRFIPVNIVDTAGLVPDAWKGRGLGNQFLDKISKADVLIHVVDASGGTDKEGKPVEPGTNDPLEDIVFLERELVYWVKGILEREWPKIIKSIEHQKKNPLEVFYSQLSGLKFDIDTVRKGLEYMLERAGKPSKWLDHEKLDFVKRLLIEGKPIVIAANKIDIHTAQDNIKRMSDKGYDVWPISALSEYVLKKLSSKNIIRYMPGDSSFELVKEDVLDERQKRALDKIRKLIFERYGGTNIQNLINHVVFDIMNFIVVYPVRNPSKLSDADGNVLPDAYLVPNGTTVRDLAYMIHSDVGEHLLHGIDVRTGNRLKTDYILKNNDVISLVTTLK
jgi:hypothetical protein